MIKSEHIPDEDWLYHRVHENHFRKGDDLPPSAIGNTGFCIPPGMSTDWSKYSTPVQTKNRGKQPPENYRVIKMMVGDVRNITEQVVQHTPSEENDSHTTIYGPKDSKHPEIRVKFKRITKLLSDDDYLKKTNL
jgi:hypothetical protein